MDQQTPIDMFAQPGCSSDRSGHSYDRSTRFESRSNSFSSDFASPPPPSCSFAYASSPAEESFARPAYGSATEFKTLAEIPSSSSLMNERPSSSSFVSPFSATSASVTNLLHPYSSQHSEKQHNVGKFQASGTSVCSLSDFDPSKQVVSNYGDKTSEEYRIKRKRNNEAVKKARQKFNVKNVQVQRRLEVLKEENKILLLRRNQIRSNYELIKSVYEDALRVAEMVGHELPTSEAGLPSNAIEPDSYHSL